MANEWVDRQVALCASVTALRNRYATPHDGEGELPRVSADAIIAALGQFQECVRYLNTRRSSGAVLNLASEGNVQDALYLMLRPWVQDLVSENPTDKVANRFVVKDFISREANTIIEVKFVRDAAHGKTIAREMHDDIETYRHHPHCETLVFFVYDAESLIPDQLSLKTQIEEPRRYGFRNLRCVLIVKP